MFHGEYPRRFSDGGAKYISPMPYAMYTLGRFLIPHFLVLDNLVGWPDGLRGEKNLPDFELPRGLMGNETLID